MGHPSREPCLHHKRGYREAKPPNRKEGRKPKEKHKDTGTEHRTKQNKHKYARGDAPKTTTKQAAGTKRPSQRTGKATAPENR